MLIKGGLIIQNIVCLFFKSATPITLTVSSLKIFEKALITASRNNNVALVTNEYHQMNDPNPNIHSTTVLTHSYSDLVRDSGIYANMITELYNNSVGETKSEWDVTKSIKILPHSRICFLFDPSYEYVITLWSIWRTNAVAVPLSTSHPTKELKYYIEDCKCDMVIYQPDKNHLLEPLFAELKNVKFIEFDNSILSRNEHQHEVPQVIDLKRNEKDDGCLIIYTSGTTGNPKGVVYTYSNLLNQLDVLVNAWGWNEKDHILHVLPLHHVHGITNALCCALYAGATVQFCKFNPNIVWKKLTNIEKENVEKIGKEINVFMAVPTIYVKLIHLYEELPKDLQEKYSTEIKRMRLMVSGSSALPTPVFSKWQEITSHALLERYGMSEIGMALSNPYTPQSKRKMGMVGFPLPTVQVKIIDFETREEITSPNQPGELLVLGPSVFKEYFNRPEATKKTFTSDGWFITGDTALFDEEGYYKICGRTSVDIIKSGGYKISSLDIERVILGMSKVKECAVVGIHDEEYGERIAAIVVLRHSNDTLTLEELQEFCSKELARYKLPTRLILLQQEIPKNAMGKVSKKPLASLFEQTEAQHKRPHDKHLQHVLHSPHHGGNK
nr:unnamed protein product [Naegleria fowleri]